MWYFNARYYTIMFSHIDCFRKRIQFCLKKIREKIYFPVVLILFYFIMPNPVLGNEEKRIQTELILASSGDTIRLNDGVIPILGTLSLEGKRNIVIKGNGIDQTIISFKEQIEGAQGLSIVNCKNIVLEDFTVLDTKGDAVKTQFVDGITFRRVKARWSGGPSEENGAYGLYPVQCKNVLIEFCVATGASDAGIYVGQSENIIVRYSEAYHNVAGIEIENSIQADVYGNNSYENTGGILVFDLPGLVKKSGGNIRVYENNIIENNFENFAPPGNIVGKVPSGTGIMIMATKEVEIFDNLIINNKTAGTAVVSYYITEEPINDPSYNPYTSSVFIHNNIYKKEPQIPTLKHEIGELLFLRFGRNVPDIIYDGMLDPKLLSEDGKILYNKRLCIQNNKNAEYLNLDIKNNFDTWYKPIIASFNTNIIECDCRLNPIKKTVLLTKN